MIHTQNNNEKEVLEDRITATLAPFIAECKKEIYLPAYQAKTSDAEALGVIVSKYFRWTGDDIIKAFLSALEDANYSTLVGQIEKLTGVSI